MSAFYRRMQATAHRLLRQFGEPREITIIRTDTEAGGDPWDPEPGEPEEHILTGVVLPARQGRVEAFDNAPERDTLIDDSRRFVVVSALNRDGTPLPIAPRAGDTLRFDGVEWTVMGAGGSNSGGVQLTYEMGVSR